jgi:hypothetical protein
MSIRNLILTLWMAGTLAAQSFIQMSDPQFGMHTKNANFDVRFLGGSPLSAPTPSTTCEREMFEDHFAGGSFGLSVMSTRLRCAATSASIRASSLRNSGSPRRPANIGSAAASR